MPRFSTLRENTASYLTDSNCTGAVDYPGLTVTSEPSIVPGLQSHQGLLNRSGVTITQGLRSTAAPCGVDASGNSGQVETGKISKAKRRHRRPETMQGNAKSSIYNRAPRQPPANLAKSGPWIHSKTNSLRVLPSPGLCIS